MEFKAIISVAGYSIEAVGVFIMIIGSAISSLRFLAHYRDQPEGVAYDAYRRQLGRSIILGLEFLIAGDLIRTVVVADTLINVTILGLIVLIRTFLSFAMHLEVEGCWPWDRNRAAGGRKTTADDDRDEARSTRRSTHQKALQDSQ